MKPESSSCCKGLADAVALVDYKNDPFQLRGATCNELRALSRSLKNEAYEALIADEHFHPGVIRGFAEALEVARGRAVYAKLVGPEICSDVFRRALFNAARALHLVEDAYAAGHIATTLRDNLDPRITTSVHNLYNERGLIISMRGGSTTWRALGDDHLDDRENAENARRVKAAAYQTLCVVVADYVNAFGNQDDPPLKCDVVAPDSTCLLPKLAEKPEHQVESVTQLGGLVTEFSTVPEIFEGRQHLRSSNVGRLALGIAQPLGTHLGLRASGYFEWFWNRGFNVDDYQRGALEWDWSKRHVRSTGVRLGLQYVFTPWVRVGRWNLSVDSYLGWSNVDCKDGKVGCLFDGGEIAVGPELLMYFATLRLAPTFAIRRAAIGSNGWDPWVGFTVAFQWPRFLTD